MNPTYGTLNRFNVYHNTSVPDLYVTVGPPCSGKSSWVKSLMSKFIGQDFTRVNLDDFRSMIKLGRHWKDIKTPHFNKLEKALISSQYHLILEALNIGQNVIIENTSCNLKTINDIKNTFGKVANIRFLNFYVPLWRLKVRNVIRYIKTGKWIPPNIIEAMHNNQLKLMEGGD